MGKDNYLKQELYHLIQTDSHVFDFLQEGSLDGLWYWGLEKPENEWMNPQFWKILGYQHEDKKNSPSEWQDIIFKDDLKVANENFEKHIKNAAHPYDQVVRYRHKDGSTVWVRCRGIAIRDPSGKPIRMLGAHNDITKHKQLEHDLKNTVNEVQEANQRLEQFAYVASHDLRAPLRAIDNLVQWIEEEDNTLTPQSSDYFSLLKQRVGRMNLLIEGILQYSRVGRKNMTVESVNLTNLIDDVISSLPIPKTFSIHVDKNMPEIKTPALLLNQVLSNLINNAVTHYDKEAGNITIHCEQNHNELLISISDDGPGIPDNEKNKIFDVFYTLKSRDEKEASGMGLAIVKKAIDFMGGGISVSDNKPHGAIFEFSWPINVERKNDS